MFMKHFFKLLLLTLIVSACESSTEDGADGGDLTVSAAVTFSTELNLIKTDWQLSTIYKDTLEFISFDDNYDYGYAMFKTKDGKSVSLVYDDIIETKLSHGIFAVEWKIDSLYEAGEEESLYYDERLLSYEVIEQPAYFGDFLSEFIKAYSCKSKQLITPFLNDEIGFYSTFNPGLYCIIEQQDAPEIKSFINLDCKILDEKLIGNPCDGFPNIEDGLYFEAISYEEIPCFESPVDETIHEFTFPLEANFQSNELKKVTIITKEHQYVQLYFIKLDSDWYLWAEDFCDCSA